MTRAEKWEKVIQQANLNAMRALGNRWTGCRSCIHKKSCKLNCLIKFNEDGETYLSHYQRG